MMIRRFPILILPALFLSGCANPHSDAALLAQSALVGMPKATLLSCAGVPEHQDAEGDRERLSYVRRQTRVWRDVDYDEFPWFGRRGPLLVRPEVTSRRVDYRCEATLTVRKGVVESLSYNQGRDLPLCGTIVENCLSSGPDARPSRPFP